MKLQLQNFSIEEDTYWFILNIFWDKKQKDWSITYWIKETLYPATLEKAIIRALHIAKLNKNETLKINEYIQEVKNINDTFLLELRKILNKE